MGLGMGMPGTQWVVAKQTLFFLVRTEVVHVSFVHGQHQATVVAVAAVPMGGRVLVRKQRRVQECRNEWNGLVNQSTRDVMILVGRLVVVRKRVVRHSEKGSSSRRRTTMP
jgi:hypothetical protein